MSKIEKQYGWAELQDGTTWEGVRVPFASKVAYERTARTRGWDAEKQPFTTGAFWSWHAAKTAGITSLGWDEFLANVVDAGITDTAPESEDDLDQDDDDSAGAQVTGVRPTEAAPSTPQPSASLSDQDYPSITGSSIPSY